MNNFTCAISGESPITDPVCTPTGHICSKRLLLLKLTETNGRDPFQPSSPLDESQLIDLSTATSVSASNNNASSPIPPKPPNATSVPSLLNHLQSSYDALVLELYETRKALEDTRRELSESLYQNDAAVRVVARVVLERDIARNEAKNALRATVSTDEEGLDEEHVGAKRRRTMGQKDTPTVVPGDDAEMEVIPPPISSDTDQPSSSQPPPEPNIETIPPPHASQLEAVWSRLSSLRKRTLKARKKRDKQLAKSSSSSSPNSSDDYPSPSTFQTWSCTDTKSLHKASAKAGVLALTSPSPLLSAEEDVGGTTTTTTTTLVTAAKDRQLVFYNPSTRMVVHKQLMGTYTSTNRLHSALAEDGTKTVVACVGDDGSLRVYSAVGSNNGGDGEGVGNVAWETCGYGSVVLPNRETETEEDTKGGDGVPVDVAGVRVHPTGSHVFVVTKQGVVHLYSIEESSGNRTGESDGSNVELKLELVASFREETTGETKKETEGETTEEKEMDGTSTCVGLHPDGLILAVGRMDGNLALWDLKTQKLAGVLEGTTASKITAVSFSENGYHVATSSLSGTVTIWDLRKQSIVSSLQAPSPSEDEAASAEVHSLAFCPHGKYLAYGTSHSTVVVVSVAAASGGGSGSADDATCVVLRPVKKETRKGKKSKATKVVENVVGLAWGMDARSLMSCNDAEKGVRFWGAVVGEEKDQ